MKRPLWLEKDILRWLDLQIGKDPILVSAALREKFNLTHEQANIAIGYWRFK